MRQRLTLLKRIERLEGRKKRRAIPKLVFALGEDAGEISGFRLGNVTILRLAGESAKDCLGRSFRIVPTAASAAALYAAQESDGHASGTPTAPTPSDALSGPENGASNPFALAGIGRQASADELWASGWLKGPPERPR